MTSKPQGIGSFLTWTPSYVGQSRSVEALDERQLALRFDTGDTLVIHDSPEMRSAWFYRYNPADHNAAALWFGEDLEPSDL